MNQGHLGIALIAVGMIGIMGSAVGMSQVTTPSLEKSAAASAPQEEIHYWKSDSVELWTDPTTGCKYVRATGSSSSYTVRIKPDGKPLCE